MNNTSTCVEQLQSGDVEAFEALYNQWSGKLYNFSQRFSTNGTFQAEDIVQLVFVKIWEIRQELDSSKNFESLIYTIARNLIRNMHQRRMYEILYAEKQQATYNESVGSDSNTVEEELDCQFLHNLVNQFIDELPTQRRKIFILSRRDYMTHKEIAELLDISVHTVESQISKALATLKAKLNQHNFVIILPFIGTIITQFVK